MRSYILIHISGTSIRSSRTGAWVKTSIERFYELCSINQNRTGCLVNPKGGFLDGFVPGQLSDGLLVLHNRSYVADDGGELVHRLNRDGCSLPTTVNIKNENGRIEIFRFFAAIEFHVHFSAESRQGHGHHTAGILINEFCWYHCDD